MNHLPFFPLSTDTLIPHPDNTYSFTYTAKTIDGTQIKTSNIILDDISYEDAFILIPTLEENEPLDIGSFSTLNGKSEILIDGIYEVTLFVTIHFQVEIFNYFNDLTISFKEKEYINHGSLFNELDDLKILLKTTENLQGLLPPIFFKEADPLKFFNHLYVLLNPSLKDDLDFYKTSDLEKRYLLLCKQLTAFLVSKDTIGESLDQLPDYVLEKKEKEKERLSNLSSMSTDYASTLDYLDLLDSIPWSQQSEAKIDIYDIQTNLNKSHYGLTNVKQNILEYFALEQLTFNQVGNVFLFAGPPGTGKTTIAKAIATSIGREYIHISLGGVSDESEIRGHRRTYIGSKPGRIVSALTKCKTINPLILLDEIDKVSSSKGDPNAALLELLDTVQNSTFVDRYLEIPIDLSKCIFICTANNKNILPEPLLDRMETIDFENYTLQEKDKILKDFIIPSIKNLYKLTSYEIVFAECIQEQLVNFNLREIKRIVSRMYRYAAHQILVNGKSKIIIDIQVYKQLYKRKEKRKGFGFASNIRHNEYKTPPSQKNNQ